MFDVLVWKNSKGSWLTSCVSLCSSAYVHVSTCGYVCMLCVYMWVVLTCSSLPRWVCGMLSPSITAWSPETQRYKEQLPESSRDILQPGPRQTASSSDIWSRGPGASLDPSHTSACRNEACPQAPSKLDSVRSPKILCMLILHLKELRIHSCETT